MPKPTVKKNSLFPIAYDEVSLVDEGAAGSAHVLITKRRPVVPKNQKGKKGKGKKNRYGFEVTNATTGQVVASSKDKPCKSCAAAKKKNSTGKKDGKSTRSQNWKEERHPRDEKGQMTQSSSESKAAHGKGGTTQAKLDAQCKKCRKKKGKKGTQHTLVTPIGKTNQPTAMSRWDSEAHIRAIMERK